MRKNINQLDKFIMLSDVSSSEFAEAMDIYVQAFPKNERQSLDKIAYRVKHNYCKLIIVKSTTVVGFSLFYPFDELQFALLDYMAIRQEYRNLGIGSRLFQKTYELFAKEAPISSFLLLEVEDPTGGRFSERRTRLERVKFYEKLGARVIRNFKYLLPPMSSKYPTEMLLMIYSEKKQWEINSNNLRNILIALYEVVYERRPGDPYLIKMLDSLTCRGKFHMGIIDE